MSDNALVVTFSLLTVNDGAGAQANFLTYIVRNGTNPHPYY